MSAPDVAALASAPNAAPRRTGLKRQFLLLIIAIYLLTGSVALALFALSIRGVTRQLAEDFAVQYVLRQKARLQAPIQREVALSRALADSPLLKQWARDEENPALKAQALAELDSYRHHFADQSYFWVIDQSRHYYHNNAADAYRGRELVQTLDPGRATDQWYFATLAKVSDFDLNVNYDTALKVTKVWINVIVRAGADRVGMAGTGLELDRFIDTVLREDQSGVQTLLLDASGAIKAYHNRDLVDLNAVAKPEIERSTLLRLLDSAEDQAALRAALTQLAEGQSPVVVLPLRVAGQSRLVALSHLDEINWFAAVLVEPAYVHSMSRFLQLAVLLALSLLVMALAVTVLLNRLVLGPLARLHQSAQAIAAGDYTQRATVEATNEIGELTQTFNDMAAKVGLYTDHLEQCVTERTEELARAHRQLAETHEQMLDSVQYARLIQQAMLPRPAVLARALGEVFVLWRPRELVGGDFYYCRTDGQGCLLVVGDCTGHGVPGALMTMSAYAVLNHITSVQRTDDPARILQELNRQLQHILHQDQADESFENGLDAGVCHWSPATGTLLFAGARFDLFHQAPGAAPEVIRGDRHSLGYRGSNPQAIFHNQRLDDAVQRTFYLSSDGLFDQAGGLKGYGFGQRRFLAVLAEMGTAPLAVQQAVLERALADWQGEQPQRDDITVIGFRPEPVLAVVRSSSRGGDGHA
ncbi:MAG TPA: SpoIIE family protein phosphatase [Candidatus Competibacteraceae bacterium]|nr:SpoIIE family protein phosphatase [Candidatus Competibacteraceae bacterium]